MPAHAEISGLGPGAIAAIVRDAGGKPLAGVHVVASGPAQREADTGKSGYVTLQALPLGTYTLRAVRGGYAPLEQTVAVSTSVASGLKVLALRLVAVNFRPRAGLRARGCRPRRSPGATPTWPAELGALPGITLLAGTAPAFSGVSLDGDEPARCALHPRRHSAGRRRQHARAARPQRAGARCGSTSRTGGARGRRPRFARRDRRHDQLSDGAARDRAEPHLRRRLRFGFRQLPARARVADGGDGSRTASTP